MDKLRDRIESMDKKQHIELAQILVKEVVPDENKNGLFFNLSTMKPETIAKIEEWLMRY